MKKFLLFFILVLSPLFIFGCSSACSDKDKKIEYYENGKVKSHTCMKNNEKNELEIIFYENGSKYSVAKYKNGKLNGTYKSFHENGMLESKVKYVDGLKDSVEKKYYINKQLFSKEKYVKGVPVGDFISYHKNGKIMMKAKYVDGLFSGEFLKYHENETLAEKGMFVQGVISGKVYGYFDDGKTVKYEDEYDNGVIVGDRKLFDRDHAFYVTYKNNPNYVSDNKDKNVEEFIDIKCSNGNILPYNDFINFKNVFMTPQICIEKNK